MLNLDLHGNNGVWIHEYTVPMEDSTHICMVKAWQRLMHPITRLFLWLTLSCWAMYKAVYMAFADTFVYLSHCFSFFYGHRFFHIYESKYAYKHIYISISMWCFCPWSSFFKNDISCYHWLLYIDWLVQERRDPIANALKLRLCTNQWIWV